MSTGCSAISRSLHVSVLLAGVLALHSPPSSSAFQAGKPGEQTARPQQTVIRISKATTRITEPLDARGFVDYVRAFEARAARGVTPQNNFEVIVRNVMRLDTVPTASIGRYYARIGIPVPDKDRPVFQRCDEYLRSLPSFQDYEDLDISSDDRKSVPLEEWQVSTRPWKAAEHPEVAGWLAKNGRFLDQLVEGSRRTGYYVPYFFNDESEAEPPSPLRMTPRYGEACGQLRHPGSGLNIRVMQRIGAGELDQAWSDIQALRRIASHLENRLTVTETLNASFFREWEFRAEIHLLNTSGFTDRQARQIFEVLRPQIDFVPMYDDVTFARRFSALDTVAVLARSSGEKNRSRFLRHLFRIRDVIQLHTDLTAVNSGPESARAGTTSRIALRSVSNLKESGADAVPIDWNVTLTVVNSWYDRWAAALAEPDFQRRRAQLDGMSRDVRRLKQEIPNARQLRKLIRADRTGAAIGRKIGNHLVLLLEGMDFIASDNLKRAADRVVAMRRVIRTAFAVELYRRDTGSLPATLDGIAPDCLPAVPEDPFSGKALKYTVNDDDFLIYSVGSDGEDDQGRTIYDAIEASQKTGVSHHSDWNDICARVRRK